MARRFTIPPKCETSTLEQDISTLIDTLRSESETKRVQAAYALSQIKDKAAVHVFTEVLRDESEQVRQQAADALDRINN